MNATKDGTATPGARHVAEETRRALYPRLVVATVIHAGIVWSQWGRWPQVAALCAVLLSYYAASILLARFWNRETTAVVVARFAANLGLILLSGHLSAWAFPVWLYLPYNALARDSASFRALRLSSLGIVLVTGVVSLLDHAEPLGLLTCALMSLATYASAERRLRFTCSILDELAERNEDLRRAHADLADRSRELLARNREMRVVLDSVDRALLVVDAGGCLATERSAMADRWFGPFDGQPRLAEYFASVDADFASAFEVGFEALLEDVMPRDVCLGQLPARVESRGRTYACAYVPILDGVDLDGLLLVISDVTEQLRQAEEQTSQLELLAVTRELARDRDGFVAYFDESGRLLCDVSRRGTDEAAQKRYLHTLKGNAATLGMNVVAELCHAAETELEEAGAVAPATLGKIRARLAVIEDLMSTLFGQRGRDLVQVSTQDIAALSHVVRRGAAADEILAQIAQWSWEPVGRPLDHLARHAVSLAMRLGKGPLEVEVDAPTLRLDPARFRGFWSALTHVVRNAIDHGLERPEERAAAGKAEPRLRLAAVLRGGVLVIEVKDDGRGIDWRAVERKARARNMPAGSRAELVHALLSPGFSTRDEVTTTSGRGVGLSAVHAATLELGGEMIVESSTGEGTTWRFSLPVSAERRTPKPRPPSHPPLA